jgi:hypothetical protein
MQDEERGWTSLLNSKCKQCAAIANAGMNFNPALGIHFQIANSYAKLRGIFKGSHKIDFSKTSAALSL